MIPIYNSIFTITCKDNFDGRVNTFQTMLKNEREVNKFMKQMDCTLVEIVSKERGVCIGYK